MIRGGIMAKKESNLDLETKLKLEDLKDRSMAKIDELNMKNKELYSKNDENGFERCIKVNMNNEKIQRIRELLNKILKKRGI